MKKGGSILLFVILTVVIIEVYIHWDDIREHFSGKKPEAKKTPMQEDVEAALKRISDAEKEIEVLKDAGTDEYEEVNPADNSIDRASFDSERILAEFYNNMASKYGNERFNPLNQYAEKLTGSGFIAEKQRQLAEKLKK